MAYESMSADKHWGGVCCKGKGWRDGGEHKGGKNQEDEEIADGTCTGCGGEEKIISSIQKFVEERDEFLFYCVCMFERVDTP